MPYLKMRGVDAYCRYQAEREEIPLESGVAFSLVKKFLTLNERDPANPRVEVILLSRNSADTGFWPALVYALGECAVSKYHDPDSAQLGIRARDGFGDAPR